MNDIVVIGGGGHAKVIIDILRMNSVSEGILLDDDPQTADISGFVYNGEISQCSGFGNCQSVIAIGNNHTRKVIAEKYDLEYITLIHPTAIIGNDVEIGSGTVVMAGAVINSGARIGKHCIINTGAVIEHDCRIGDFVHISPKACLGGTVHVKDGSWIGLGVNVKNNTVISNDCIVGVGAVVINDIPANCVAVGCPAKPVKWL